MRSAALEAIAHLPDPQIGLRLLRSCHGFSKLAYSWRTIPRQLHLLSSTVFCVRRLFAVSDDQWAQASRGLWCGGLGLRASAKHAPAAYVASRMATRQQCRVVDPTYQWEGTVPESPLTLAMQRQNAAILPPKQFPVDTNAVLSQQELSKALDEKEHEGYIAVLSASDRATLLSEMLPGASGVLEVIPSKETGLD